MNKRITGDEIVKIKMMCEYGMNSRDIAQVTGRSVQTITRIKYDNYDEYKRKQREYVKQRRGKETPAEKPTPAITPQGLDSLIALVAAMNERLTALCDELGIGNKTADKSGLTA